jgi:Protein of unknown function (DUF3828)
VSGENLRDRAGQSLKDRRGYERQGNTAGLRGDHGHVCSECHKSAARRADCDLVTFPSDHFKEKPMTRRCLAAAMAVAALAALIVQSKAAEQTAKDFVSAIYEPYKGKDAKGTPLDSDAAVNRFFEPALATLILKDQKESEKRGEAPSLDSDPFVDAQEWEIDTVDVAVRENGPEKASATVTFKNFGKPTTVVLDLVKSKKGWRIADIRSESGSLKDLFKKK